MGIMFHLLNEGITLQPALLQWARQRAGLREADLGKKLGIKKAPEDQVEQWEKDGIITYSRVQKIAKITHTPFGYLFLSTPPVEVRAALPHGGQRGSRPSQPVTDVLYDAMRKQSWYRDYLLDLAEDPLDFIGSVTLKQSPVAVAAAIRKRFRFDVSLRTAAENWEQALGFMFDHCEDEGVMVIRSGVAESPLNDTEIALTDAYRMLVGRIVLSKSVFVRAVRPKPVDRIIGLRPWASHWCAFSR